MQEQSMQRTLLINPNVKIGELLDAYPELEAIHGKTVPRASQAFQHCILSRNLENRVGQPFSDAKSISTSDLDDETKWPRNVLPYFKGKNI